MGSSTWHIFLYVFFITIVATKSSGTTKFVTQTVYGFLDFTTTIGNTIMVFSPESAPTLELIKNKVGEPTKIIETKPMSYDKNVIDTAISPTKLQRINSTQSDAVKLPATSKKVGKNGSSEKVTIQSPSAAGDHPIRQQKNSVAYIESNLYKPEYDLLSRQPTEFIEETFRLVNINSGARTHHSNFRNLYSRNCDSDDAGEFANNNGSQIVASCVPKSAQVLHSTEHGLHKGALKPRISPSLTPRILRTAAPSASALNREELPVNSSFSLRRQSGLSKKFRNRGTTFAAVAEATATPQKQAERTNNIQIKSKKSPNRNKSKRRNKHVRNTDSEKRSIHTTSVVEEGRRLQRLKTYSTIAQPEASSSIYTFKLNRAPGRWQYKTSPKPKVSIRKPVNTGSSVSANYTSTASSADLWRNNNSSPNSNFNAVNVDMEQSGSQNGAVINNADFDESKKFMVETLNVEISTPADFKDTYYEIATIKTPYIFQAGVIKKTRFITVTSTFEKTLETEVSAVFDGPLTENILTSSAKAIDLQLDGSITTLSPLLITGSEETPSLDVVTTESYTFKQRKLETKVLPILHDGENSTSYVTAIQTYDIKNLITVTRTLLPHDTHQFVPSRSLKDFNINLDEAGSEINFDLEFADEDNIEHEKGDTLFGQLLPNNTNFANTTTSPAEHDQLQQLGLLNIYNSNTQKPITVLNGRPLGKIQTLWQSHVIPIINGQTTSYRTISQSVGTVDNTNYEVTSAQPQMPSFNPYLLPAPQQFQTITSPSLQQTFVTETNSKVLKLTFGAKTTYTTLFSTYVLPTLMTTFVTTSIPVHPTVAFPGYFPPPYSPFPYVG